MGINREILKLALPNIAANVSIPLLGMVDTAVVGHMPESHYLGALAVGTMIFNFLYWGLGFLAMGTTGMTAQAWGRRDQQETSRVLQRGVLVALVGGLLMILLQSGIAALAFPWVESTPEVLGAAVSYFHIRIWAAPATLTLMVLSGWFLGMQDARTPMILTLAINLLNILGNLTFVYGLGLFSDGVAWGTVVAQYCGVLFAFFLLRWRFPHLPLEQNLRRLFDPEVLLHFFRVNRDILIRTLALISVFSFFTVASAWEGEAVLAANSLLMQLWMLISFAVDGFANAGQGLVGRFIGQRDASGLRQCIRLLLIWAAGIGGTFALLYEFAGPLLLKLFTSHDEVVALAQVYLPWLVVGALLNLFAFIWDGIYIGATATRTMRNAMLGCAAAFFVLYALLEPLLSNHGLWLALTVFMVLRGASLGMLSSRAIFPETASAPSH